MLGDNGNKIKHSASDDLKEATPQEKFGLIYIYRQGEQDRFEMSIPVNEPMGKLFAINLLNNVTQAIINAPMKNKPQIQRAPPGFLNKLRNFKHKR